MWGFTSTTSIRFAVDRSTVSCAENKKVWRCISTTSILFRAAEGILRILPASIGFIAPPLFSCGIRTGRGVVFKLHSSYPSERVPAWRSGRRFILTLPRRDKLWQLFSASRVISRIVSKPKSHYLFHKSRNHIYPFVSQVVSFPQVCHLNPLCVSSLIRAKCPAHPIVFHFIPRKFFSIQFSLLGPSLCTFLYSSSECLTQNIISNHEIPYRHSAVQSVHIDSGLDVSTAVVLV